MGCGGRILGVTGVDMGLDSMQENLLLSTDYHSAHLVVLAEDGTVLIDSADDEKVGKNVLDVGYDPMAQDAEEVFDASKGGMQVSALLSGKGETLAQEKRDFRYHSPVGKRKNTVDITYGG